VKGLAYLHEDCEFLYL
jgi:serine/threonine protein kinase